MLVLVYFLNYEKLISKIREEIKLEKVGGNRDYSIFF